MTFEYHGLGNTDLWAEYGFVESPSGTVPTTSSGTPPTAAVPPVSSGSSSDHSQQIKTDRWSSAQYSTVQVAHLVSPLWTVDVEKEEVLKRIDCWQHNTLHPYPTFEASHGLLMTLRVLHLQDHERGRLDAIGAGRVVFVSEENEKLVKRDLGSICVKLLDEVEHRTKVQKGDEGEDTEEEDGMISLLWDEQESVARGCLGVYS